MKINNRSTQSFDVIELFYGSATISNTFKEKGHRTLSIDIRQRKGICIPDFRADVMTLQVRDILIEFKKKHGTEFRNDRGIIWSSPPCTIYSHTSGGFYLKEGKPVNESARYFLRLTKKSLDIIARLSPVLYFIENPRGHLRYQKNLIDFLVKNNGMTKELTYSSYGFPSAKPTNIFTNAHDYIPKELGKFGRGNKSPERVFDNMTTCQRQKVPVILAKEIVKYCEDKLCSSLKTRINDPGTSPLENIAIIKSAIHSEDLFTFAHE